MIKLPVLLFMQTIFIGVSSLHVEDELEKGISYPYPFFNEDADSLSDEDTSKRGSKADSSRDESPNAWHGKVGKAKVTVDVENTDILSQWQAKWEAKHKKEEPKKKKRSYFSRDDDDDEGEGKKDDHSPRASFLIEWGKD